MGTGASKLETVFQESIVWDAHCGLDPQVPPKMASLERIRKAGFTYVSTNVGYDVLPWEETVLVIGAYRRWARENSDNYILVSNVRDVETAKREGKLAVSMDIEGVNALNDSVDMVDVYHRLGVRQISFVYNLDNAAGGGCHGDNTGLTTFGREVIEEMNRVGMLVDGSHCGAKMAREMAEATNRPMIISHANSRALCDHPRNHWDEQIKACAGTGGVVGVTGIRVFLCEAGDNSSDLELLVRHIDHMCDLVGPKHVGIGSDFTEITNALETRWEDSRSYWPEEHYPRAAEIGFVDIEVFPQLTDALAVRGYSDEDVSGILGGNFMRVAREIWD